MEELKVKAIVLNSRDYKEKDKLVELYSLEQGKITVLLKGCKMPTSKLRFAYQSFCFADFLLVKNNNFYVVTNCNLIDSFYDLVNDTSNFIKASLMLEIADNLKYVTETQGVFLNLLYALKAICYEKIDCKIVCTKFILEVLKILGYKPNFNTCLVCKLPFINSVYLNLDSGAFVCNNCTNGQDVSVSKNQLACMKIIDNCEYERLGSIKIKNEVLNEIVDLLVENLEIRIGTKLKSKEMLKF